MAKTAGPETELLLRRVRQYGGVACDFDFAMQILSKCQRIVNAGRRLDTSSATLTTVANQLVYNLRDDVASDVVDIIQIDVSGRILQKCVTFSELSAYDLDWFQATGTRFETWLQVGRDLMILYPALTSASSVTVTYSTLTTEYESRNDHYNTAIDIEDEYFDEVLSLAEIVLLTRGRQYDAATKVLKRFGIG